MAKVLIVDEDAVLRDFVKASLREDGFEVYAASRKPATAASRYDAVLSDLDRPFSLDKLQRQLRRLRLHS